MGSVQRRLLDLLADETHHPQGPEHPWWPVTGLAASVYAVSAPTASETASARRALRRLAAVGLVELRRGRTGRTYRQRRRKRTRYLVACGGPGCHWCRTVVRRRHGRQPVGQVADLLREISGAGAAVELERLTTYGFHEWVGSRWDDYDYETWEVAVSEVVARRALTDEERVAEDERSRRLVARALEELL